MSTADNGLPAPGAPARRTHRLLDEAALRQRFRPEVVAYILAVRAELVARFGEVDTYRRFAAELKRQCPNLGHYKARDLARRRAEHFNNPAGPPWSTVEEVLQYVVDAEHREACRQRFAESYTAARHQVPPPSTQPRSAATVLTATRRDILEFEHLRLHTELGIRNQQVLDYTTHLAAATRENSEMTAQLSALRIELVSARHENRWLRRRLGLNPDTPLHSRRANELRRPPTYTAATATSLALACHRLAAQLAIDTEPAAPTDDLSLWCSPSTWDQWPWSFPNPVAPRSYWAPEDPEARTAFHAHLERRYWQRITDPAPPGYIGHHRRRRQRPATPIAPPRSGAPRHPAAPAPGADR